MTAANSKYDGSELQFEDFPEQADIKVSKVLTTSKGDKIRVIVTTGESVVLTATGQRDGDTVTVIGDPELVATALLGEIWDAVKGVAGKALDLLTKGCSPMTVTQVNVGPDGKVTSITTTTTCVPN